MKADVQYNDFVGTSAADISDNTNLKTFLKDRGVDTDRYEAIGSKFFSHYNDFNASIICIDKEKSEGDNLHIVSISFENDFDKREYFNLFKRYEVITVPEYYNKFKINDEITHDDRVGDINE